MCQYAYFTHVRRHATACCSFWMRHRKIAWTGRLQPATCGCLNPGTRVFRTVTVGASSHDCYSAGDEALTSPGPLSQLCWWMAGCWIEAASPRTWHDGRPCGTAGQAEARGCPRLTPPHRHRLPSLPASAQLLQGNLWYSRYSGKVSSLPHNPTSFAEVSRGPVHSLPVCTVTVVLWQGDSWV